MMRRGPPLPRPYIFLKQSLEKITAGCFNKTVLNLFVKLSKISSKFHIKNKKNFVS